MFLIIRLKILLHLSFGNKVPDTHLNTNAHMHSSRNTLRCSLLSLRPQRQQSPSLSVSKSDVSELSCSVVVDKACLHEAPIHSMLVSRTHTLHNTTYCTRAKYSTKIRLQHRQSFLIPPPCLDTGMCMCKGPTHKHKETLNTVKTSDILQL